MKVRFKRLHPDAVIPSKANASDFCYDVTAVTEEQIAQNVWKYGLGFALQLAGAGRPKEARRNGNIYSIDFRPRSSVWKTGMVLSNCEGTIDEGYTGEISAVFYHVLPDMPRYKVGDRIGQIKVGCTTWLEFEEVEELEKTERGSGGFGSTGR